MSQVQVGAVRCIIPQNTFDASSGAVCFLFVGFGDRVTFMYGRRSPRWFKENRSKKTVLCFMGWPGVRFMTKELKCSARIVSRWFKESRPLFHGLAVTQINDQGAEELFTHHVSSCLQKRPQENHA